MTRAASDCTSEHGKNYLDSRLMSDMAIYRQSRPIKSLTALCIHFQSAACVDIVALKSEV